MLSLHRNFHQVNPNLPSYYQENYLTLFPLYLATYIETPLLKPPMLLIHLLPLLFHYFHRQRPSFRSLSTPHSKWLNSILLVRSQSHQTIPDGSFDNLILFVHMEIGKFVQGLLKSN